MMMMIQYIQVLINWDNNNDDNYDVINVLNQMNSESIPNPSVEDMACVSLWAILELKKTPNLTVLSNKEGYFIDEK